MTLENHDRDQETAPLPAANVDDLLIQCHRLLKELELFQEFLVERKREHTVELRQFRSSIISELKSLQRVRRSPTARMNRRTMLTSQQLAGADPNAERTIHTLRSSNLPFYTAIWTAAKSCKGLVLFNKRFYWDPPRTRAAQNARPRKRCALVDIVAEDGEEWVKVSTITESRLLFERAKAGWEGHGSSSDTEGEDEDGGKVVANGFSGLDITEKMEEDGDASDEDDDRVELLKIADDLRRAAGNVRIRYRHPKVRFILPKIVEGRIEAIDEILREIRATGAKVQCANHKNSRSTPITNGVSPYDHGNLPAPTANSTDSLEQIFSRLLVDPLAHLTAALNIDCTILLALISDLSHSALEPSPTLHRAIRRQIDIESKEQLLPTSLWPAMVGRDLVCTEIAAQRMREIVDQIGTSSEKTRAALMLGECEAGKGKSPEELTSGFAETSDYQVPADWRLPIRVVKGEYDISQLPTVARRVEAELTEINKSVFLYGWVSGWTTVSSNRTVARTIEGIIEAEGEDGDVGPSVWLCGTARSLVGKEKGRKG